jgi:sec-independent protein translocase protein TatA
MPHLGPTELIIILVIVVVLFGAGRVSRLGGELGSAIREFRRGIGAGEEKPKTPEEIADTTSKQA